MRIRQTYLGRNPAGVMRRGTSLIEILIVLVILVVGILSIVRLFPAGFIALRNAQDSTFADRLAAGAIEAMKKDGASLPDAIYMYSETDGFIPNYAPGNYGPYPPVPGTANPAYNDINKARYISNETMIVPSSHVDSTTGKSYPPLYFVNYGPIYLPNGYTSTAPGALSMPYLHITSTPWTPITGDSRQVNAQSPRSLDNPTDILSPGDAQYLVDYNEGAIAVPPANYDQKFTLIITFPDGTTALRNLDIPASYAGGWFSTVDTTNGTALSPGPWSSASLARPFAYMGTSNQPVSDNKFTNDPYEYVVFDSNFTGSDANPGVIAFNPAASGRAGAQAVHARISYMVYDWHIMREDRNIPAGSPSIRLTINHLKKIGDVQFDQSTFGGLISNVSDPTQVADIMMLDLNTGNVTYLNGQSGANTVDSDTATAPDQTKYQVSYQNGRITVPSGSASQNVRIYYAGDADWALAIQKAPSVYTALDMTKIKELAETSLTAPDYPMPNQYVVDEAMGRVYFPICDSGKTVEFDDISYTNASGVPRHIGEGTATISTDLAPVISPPSPLAPHGVPYVNLTDKGLNSSSIIPDGIAARTLKIGAVRGVSARAVVIWHENNVWRTRTLDTLLTQP